MYYCGGNMDDAAVGLQDSWGEQQNF